MQGTKTQQYKGMTIITIDSESVVIFAGREWPFKTIKAAKSFIRTVA